MPATTTSYGCCGFLTTTFKRFNIKSITTTTDTPQKTRKKKRDRRRYLQKHEVSEAQAYYTQSMAQPFLQQSQGERTFVLAVAPSLPKETSSKLIRRQASLPATSNNNKQPRKIGVRRTVSSSSSLEDINKNELFSSYAIVEKAFSQRKRANNHQKTSTPEPAARRMDSKIPVAKHKDSTDLTRKDSSDPTRKDSSDSTRKDSSDPTRRYITATRAQEQILKNPCCKRLIHDNLYDLPSAVSYGQPFYHNTKVSQQRGGISLIKQQKTYSPQPAVTTTKK